MRAPPPRRATLGVRAMTMARGQWPARNRPMPQHIHMRIDGSYARHTRTTVAILAGRTGAETDTWQRELLDDDRETR